MSRSQLVTLWMAFCGAFSLLAWLVRRGATARLDRALEHRLEAASSPRFERLSEPLTTVGLLEVTLGLALLLGIGALLLGRHRLALAFSLVWLSLPVELALKWLLDLSPSDLFPLRATAREMLRAASGISVEQLAEPPGSFPSGHVARTAFLVGLLVFLLLGRTRSWVARIALLPAVSAAGALIVAMGYTRVLNGHHTPSDVLGGYLLGLALLMPAVLVLGRRGESA